MDVSLQDLTFNSSCTKPYLQEIEDKCPKCGKPLEAKQINLTMALFLCTDVRCPYPVNSQCYVVQRDIKDVNNPVNLKAALEQMKKTQKQNLDSEVFDVTDLEGLLDVFLKDEGGCEIKEEASVKTEVPTVSQSQNSCTEDLDFILELLNWLWLIIVVWLTSCGWVSKKTLISLKTGPTVQEYNPWQKYKSFDPFLVLVLKSKYLETNILKWTLHLLVCN